MTVYLSAHKADYVIKLIIWQGEHELPRSNGSVVVHFAVKFYIDNICWLRDPTTVEQFYLQVHWGPARALGVWVSRGGPGVDLVGESVQSIELVLMVARLGLREQRWAGVWKVWAKAGPGMPTLYLKSKSELQLHP